MMKKLYIRDRERKIKQMRNKRGVIAISEIILIVFGMIAISYSIGSELRFVSGTVGGDDNSGGGSAINPVISAAPHVKSVVSGGLTSLVEGAKLSPGKYKAGSDLGNFFDNVKGFDKTKDFSIGFSGKDSILTQEGNSWTIEGQPTVGTGGASMINSGGTPTKETGLLSKIFGVGDGGIGRGLMSGAAWGLSLYLGTQMLGSMFGFDKAQVNAASAALGLGAFAGRTIYSMGLKAEGGKILGMQASTAGWVVGGGVAIAVFLMMYKKESTEIVTFDCKPWDAPMGGSDCEKCNDGVLPCSEYQCRALGQACALVNEEDEKEAKCVNIHRGDVNPPVITPWSEVLDSDFLYTPNNAVSPPDRGVFIKSETTSDGCVQAYTPMVFGIQTDEPSRCKIDYQRRQKIDDMRLFFGGSSLFKYNHTQSISLPGPNASAEFPILENGGNFELYVKCIDAMGNQNEGDFLFSFCVDDGPDATAPLIVTTNLVNGMPVAYQQNSVDIEVYVNEPSSCKWSRRDQSYEEMEKSMVCSSSVFEMNAQSLYKCLTTLDGINDNQDNYYYFRCEDKSNNVNKESYEFLIKGTEPLYINEIKINDKNVSEIIKDSTDVIKTSIQVQTSAGYNKGQSQCFFSEGDGSNYILFGDTDNTNGESVQDLYLPEGEYKYYIKCVDLGGNSDEREINFEVESDSSSPIIARAYNSENELKLITTEEANCVYDINDCKYSFEDGIVMDSEDDIEHFVTWDPQKTYYVKCEDEYGNRPVSNQCSIIVRAFKTSE